MKQRNLKGLIITAFILLVVGAFLVGVGFATGGSKLYANINSRSASWWPFGNVGINLTNWDDEVNEEESYTYSFEDIAKLKIKADVGNVYIRSAYENKIILENVDPNVYKVDISSDEVSIKLNGNISEYAKLYVDVKPEILSKLEIKSDVGNIEVSGLTLNDLEVSTDMGKVKMDHMIAKTAELSADAGKMDITDSAFDNSEISVSAGSVYFDGSLKGNHDISCDAGQIDLNLKGNALDYHYKIDNDLGQVKFNGESYNGIVETSGNTKGMYQLALDCNVGQIKVAFYE